MNAHARFTVALAGVMGGKRTSDLIPLCHPLALTDLVVAITPDRAAGVLRIRAEAATTGQTGVEMEAMTAASVAALTVYDMVKGVERGVEIRGVRLVFLAVAAFAAAAGWLLAHPLPLIVAVIIAAIDVIETSFLLLVVTVRRDGR